MMTITTATYLTYLLVSIAVTAWVARTLHQSGRVFLIDAFGGNAALADSVNRLLVVGFYLVNLGYVLLMLRMAEKPTSFEIAMEFLSNKLGLVLLLLGVMHFGNLALFSAIRRSRVAGGQLGTHDLGHRNPPAPLQANVQPTIDGSAQ